MICKQLETQGGYQTVSYGSLITTHKNTSALVWQNRGAFIFWLFANSLVGILLPNSLSQIQVCLRTGCCHGCLSGGKEATRFRKTMEVAPSSLQTLRRRWHEIYRMTKALPSQGQYLRTGYWLCAPAAKQRGRHCSLNIGPLSFLLNRYWDLNSNMSLSLILYWWFLWHCPS